MLGKRLELKRVKDGLLDLTNVDRQITVARPVRLEELAAELRECIPIGAQRVEVPIRNAAVEVRMEILNVLGLRGIDVARDVEVVVILRVGDLAEWHESGVALD